MLRKIIYPKIRSTLQEIARNCDAQGISAHQLSLASLVGHFIAGWIYAGGLFFLGGLLIIFTGITRLLVDHLEELKGPKARFRTFLDLTLDRYAEFFIYGGLCIFYVRAGYVGWFLIVLTVFVGVYASNYAKARSHQYSGEENLDFFGKPECMILLAIGSIISPLLGAVLWVLAIGTNANAFYQILITQKRIENA